MLIRKRARKKSSDNAALSDLAFLLIIYFIVIAGFNVNQGLLMDLPAKDSVRVLAKQDILRFRFDDDGTLYNANNGSAVELAAAEQMIKAAVAQHPNLALLLNVAPSCPWQPVVSFVEIAKTLNVEAFSFSKTEAYGGEIGESES